MPIAWEMTALFSMDDAPDSVRVITKMPMLSPGAPIPPRGEPVPPAPPLLRCVLAAVLFESWMPLVAPRVMPAPPLPPLPPGAVCIAVGYVWSNPLSPPLPPAPPETLWAKLFSIRAAESTP